MRYLDILRQMEAEGRRESSRDSTPYERTKKGWITSPHVRVQWSSPSFWHREGRVALVSDGDWLLVCVEHVPDALVWVRGDRLHA